MRTRTRGDAGHLSSHLRSATLRRSSCATFAAACAARAAARRPRDRLTRIWIVSGRAEPFRSAATASRRTASLPSFATSSCSSGAHVVDDAGMVARQAARARAAPSRAPPGCRRRGRGGGARSSRGTGTARSLGMRPPARGSRSSAAAASSSSSNWARSCDSSRSLPSVASASACGRRLREAAHFSPPSDRAGRADVARPTGGTAARSASARGCAPTSRPRVSTRTSQARAAAGSSAMSSTTAEQYSTFVSSGRSG